MNFTNYGTKLHSSNPKIQVFLNDVIKTLDESAITFIYHLDNFVQCDTVKCNGYFDQDERVLAISRNEDWLSTLVHEYSHFTQWKVGIPIFKKYSEATDKEDVLLKWVGGKSYTTQTIAKYIKLTQEMEFDCEDKAVDYIKCYELPINIGEYISRANAYINYYLYFKEIREWYIIGKEPWKNLRVLGYFRRKYNDKLVCLKKLDKELKCKYENF